MKSQELLLSEESEPVGLELLTGGWRWVSVVGVALLIICSCRRISSSMVRSVRGIRGTVLTTGSTFLFLISLARGGGDSDFGLSGLFAAAGTVLVAFESFVPVAESARSFLLLCERVTRRFSDFVLLLSSPSSSLRECTLAGSALLLRGRSEFDESEALSIWKSTPPTLRMVGLVGDATTSGLGAGSASARLTLPKVSLTAGILGRTGSEALWSLEGAGERCSLSKFSVKAGFFGRIASVAVRSLEGGVTSIFEAGARCL